MSVLRKVQLKGQSEHLPGPYCKASCLRKLLRPMWRFLLLQVRTLWVWSSWTKYVLDIKKKMLLVSQSLFDIIEWLYLCLLLLLKTKLPTKKSRSSSDHPGGWHCSLYFHVSSWRLWLRYLNRRPGIGRPLMSNAAPEYFNQVNRLKFGTPVWPI